jgi:predicted ribosomally synthesized peptide with SipW-like signal peptide
MRRIAFGLVLIAGASAVILSGATGAFFSDTETSVGNTFAAGAIDLKIDNESYYNGNKCTNTGTEEDPNWVWQGNALYPVPGTSCDTSFPLSDLDDGLLFFNFRDLKPDDEGEDTISIHVQNDAWACMDLTLTSNDDNSSTEPELATPDAQEDINNTWDGELAQNLQFFWWADDGDNVYEEGENSISGGVKTLFDLASTTGPFSVTLADENGNAWGGDEPLPANETVYIAKAWCFGTMTLDPVAAGEGENPSIASGILCDGTALNNLTQTDSATVDVAFRAVQARNNPNFRCREDEPRTAKITVIKDVVNNNGGNNVIADFQLFVDNGVVTTSVTSGVQTEVVAGTYLVAETGISGYVASFSGDCDAFGNITLNPGDVKTCTITNDDLPANITLVKQVTGTPPLADPSTFGLKIDGGLVPNNTSVAVTSNSPHSIDENGRAGYSFVSITGNPKCPLVLGGTVTLDEGEAITCTITNNKN